jgi:hypothetical protein
VIQRLLCILALHDWQIVSTGIFVASTRCRCCGKVRYL